MRTHAESDIAVDVQGLRKRYNDVQAVDGVDLRVTRGECVALLGPNGAGKTTTVEILEGFRRRDAGSVSVLGADPANAGSDWRSRIGIVLQAADDGHSFTVAEMVRHFAALYPSPRDPEEVITAVGLHDKRDSRIRALSGGQRRRLDVGLGIIGRPELLFLDEPTTGFDPEARRRFWSLVHTLRGEGATILLTTHYLDEAEHLADRVSVIVRGRVAACGSPAALRGASTVVSWSDPAGVSRSVETAEPTRLLRELAAAFSGEIPHLTVKPPSLEDAYLAMLDNEEAAA